MAANNPVMAILLILLSVLFISFSSLGAKAFLPLILAPEWSDINIQFCFFRPYQLGAALSGMASLQHLIV